MRMTDNQTAIECLEGKKRRLENLLKEREKDVRLIKKDIKEINKDIEYERKAL